MSLVIKTNGSRAIAAARSDISLAALSAEVGFPLNLQCGGQGACHGCRVQLGAGAYRIGNVDTTVPPGETLEAQACKTIVLSADAEIEIPTRSLLSIGECSCADFYATRKNLFQGLGHCDDEFGIAVDIGTTTVAALLVELSTGKILARDSAYNRQIEMADNIAARIALCCDADNVSKLQKLIIADTLLPMLGKLEQNISNVWKNHSEKFHCLENVTKIIFSGNTVMSHLALGLSPLCIGTIPFEPLTKVYSDPAAPELGLTCCPNATVRTVPSIAGYVGGDIVSDLYVSELTEDGLELLVDIGTNGEIVLNDRGELKATATAAGPAFEGAGLLHGKRAAEGVIETIVCNADDSIDYKTIGDAPAHGICGSAAVDFMATALNTGLLTQMGRFDLGRLQAAGRLDRMDCHGMIVNACVIVPGEITITEFDVSQIMKAKAAVYAGIRTLLERSGHQLADLDRLVLAGGFAAHLKLENAITIGLLPELPLSTFEVVGNGSLAGAYAALGVSDVWKELQAISERPESFHLAETDEFNDRFIDALALPNLDPDEFPGAA